MATLTATFLDDLGRVRLELVDPTMHVTYRVQRSTDADPTWVDVRGGGAMGTDGVTIVDDFEYTPNVPNHYRLLEPSFYDSFDRAYPSGTALELTGNSGSYLSTPDVAALDLTGDMEIAADITTTWGGVQQGIAGKWLFAGDQRSYLFAIETTGRLRFWHSPNGADDTTFISTVAVPITSGRLRVRVTFDVDNGAGGRTATFYTGPSMLGPWAQLGMPVTASGTAATFSGSAPVEIGSWNGGANGRLTGQVHAVQIRSSIGGTLVANPSMQGQTPGAGSFVDSTGKTWTVNGDAALITIAPVPGLDWGTADTGQAWFLGSTSPGYGGNYVDNGVGVIRAISGEGLISEMVTDQIPGTENAEVTWSAVYPGAAANLDAIMEYGVGLRASDTDNAYESELIFHTEADDYAVELGIGKYVADVFTRLGTASLPGSWFTGIPWNVRFRVNGSTLYARAWAQGRDEPNGWNLVVNDAEITSGEGVYVSAFKGSGTDAEFWFGPIEVTAIPQGVESTVTVTPMQVEVWLKSVTYPLFNRAIDCVDWQELTRASRNAFFDVKGRHEILGIADVGSSATFELTFISHSTAENRGIVALLTYGGVLLLQPPGDDESIECPTAFSGTPGGYVMVNGDYVQGRTVYGKPQWIWTVTFTRVAEVDAAGIIPALITWAQLWAIIGENGTWEDVWATWPTWQSLWLTPGNPLTFGEIA
jgi:hypothetical protein